jgi:hypothetical protein
MRWAGMWHVWRERRGVYRVLVRKPKGKNHLEDLGVDKRIILKLIFKKQDGVDWINLAQNGDKRWAVVNTETKVRVPQNVGNVLAK